MTVSIRPLRIEDAYTSVKWRNDSEVFQYTGNTYNHNITIESELSWIKRVIKKEDDYRCAIEVDSIYVGNVYLTDIHDGEAEYHIFIGNKEYWGKGIAKEASLLIIKYARDILNLNKIVLDVNKKNIRAIKLYESLGFVEEHQQNSVSHMCLEIKRENEILVAIHCLVYNHEPYLRDCFEGFVMQKTNFRFVAIVHEDCSTDHSADIIREYEAKYPDIFRPIYETENKYSKHDGSISRIMNAAIDATDAKYIAICEGDDYWTDPLKLQKQVDFLENHPEYGIVHTQARVFIQDKNEYSDKIKGHDVKSFEQLLCNCTIATLTVMVQRVLFLQYYNEINPEQYSWPMGDYPLWLYCSTKTKIHFINEITATYRLLSNSASHSSDRRKELEFRKATHSIQLFFAEREHVSKKLLHKINNEYEEITICRLIHISLNEAAIQLKEATELTLLQRITIFMKIIRQIILKTFSLNR